MITSITGRLESVAEGAAVLRPGSGPFAYEVLLPAYLAERLAPRVGVDVTLTTLAYLEGQGQGTSFIPRLVGFENGSDRDFFELFTTVKGIGNRKALRAMALHPTEIARLITARDAKGLTKLPEIGKRMAETVIAELTGKVERYLGAGEGMVVTGDERRSSPTAGAGDRGPAAEEAVEVLVQLGESRSDAGAMVDRCLSRQGAGARSELTTDEIVSRVFASKGV